MGEQGAQLARQREPQLGLEQLDLGGRQRRLDAEDDLVAVLVDERRRAGALDLRYRVGRRGQRAVTPSAAARSAATSSLRIPNIASIARCARDWSGSANSSSIPSGTTCHDRP